MKVCVNKANGVALMMELPECMSCVNVIITTDPDTRKSITARFTHINKKGIYFFKENERGQDSKRQKNIDGADHI